MPAQVKHLKWRDHPGAGPALLVAGAGWSAVEIVRTEQLRPVVQALREGLITGGAHFNP